MTKQEKIEVKIKRENVSVRLYVVNEEELRKEYQRLNELLTTAEALEAIIQRAKENADIYYLDSKEEVVLLVDVGTLVEKMGLILYARYPMSVQRETLWRHDVSKETVRAYIKDYPQYFQSERRAGPINLTFKGFQWIKEKVCPEIQRRVKTGKALV